MGKIVEMDQTKTYHNTVWEVTGWCITSTNYRKFAILLFGVVLSILSINCRLPGNDHGGKIPVKGS